MHLAKARFFTSCVIATLKLTTTALAFVPKVGDPRRKLNETKGFYSDDDR
jgi:hypothetical protein